MPVLLAPTKMVKGLIGMLPVFTTDTSQIFDSYGVHNPCLFNESSFLINTQRIKGDGRFANTSLSTQYSYTIRRLNTNAALVPPNPNELDNTTSIFISLA